MKYPLVLLLSLVAGWANAADWNGAPWDIRGGYDWSGSYIGGHLGFGRGGAGNDWFDPVTGAWIADGDIGYASLTGGLQIGHQRQFDSLVAGMEADLSLARYLGDDAQFAGRINEIEINALGSLRGRLGWTSGTLLVYGTAGLAAASFDKRDRDGASGAPQLAAGWTAGAGAEIALGTQWSLRAEYLHVRLGEVETAIHANGGGGYLHRANAPALDILRVGANYRF